MASELTMGAVAGGLGAVGGGLARENFAGTLAVGGFDLTPTIVASAAGAVGGLLGGGGMGAKLLAGAASGAMGDALGRVVTSLVPALSFKAGPIDVAQVGLGAGAGALVAKIV